MCPGKRNGSCLCIGLEQSYFSMDMLSRQLLLCCSSSHGKKPSFLQMANACLRVDGQLGRPMTYSSEWWTRDNVLALIPGSSKWALLSGNVPSGSVFKRSTDVSSTTNDILSSDKHWAFRKIKSYHFQTSFSKPLTLWRKLWPFTRLCVCTEHKLCVHNGLMGNL